MTLDILAHNQRAWDRQVERGDRWTIPVGPEEIAKAKKGEWEVLLTPCKAVPRKWFGSLEGKRVLGLAAAGGQQSAIFAAAGARVTSLDISPKQLEQDRSVARRSGLELKCIQGHMADLSCFPDATFDLVFHPVSNCFVEAVEPVWREAARVLRPGGVLLAGFINPVLCLFDAQEMGEGRLKVRHSLPYSDLRSLPASEREQLFGEDEPLTFGHTLSSQIGGQLDAGLALTGFYEDKWGSADLVLDRYCDSFIATRAVKLP